MSIRTNIEEVMEEVKNGDHSFGEDLRKKAVAAIKGGEASPAWQEYMHMFSKTPEQMARLTPTDNTKDNYDMDVARTYLVGNGTCGVDTTGFRLIQGIDDKLDQGL